MEKLQRKGKLHWACMCLSIHNEESTAYEPQKCKGLVESQSSIQLLQKWCVSQRSGLWCVPVNFYCGKITLFCLFLLCVSAQSSVSEASLSNFSFLSYVDRGEEVTVKKDVNLIISKKESGRKNSPQKTKLWKQSERAYVSTVYFELDFY